jgi:plastocyanin domain-containing protein
MKSTITSIIIAGLFVALAIFLAKSGSSNSSDFNVESEFVNNVSVNGDTQVISISARGGYSPRTSIAKANMPTILRVETKGTYDCSTSLVVPDANYRGFLKPTGVEEIKLPPQKAGAMVRGLCSMGMYSFSIKFE